MVLRNATTAMSMVIMLLGCSNRTLVHWDQPKSCDDGTTRCFDGNVQTCLNNHWGVKEDCFSVQKTCRVTGGQPMCEEETASASEQASELETDSKSNSEMDAATDSQQATNTAPSFSDTSTSVNNDGGPVVTPSSSDTGGIRNTTPETDSGADSRIDTDSSTSTSTSTVNTARPSDTAADIGTPIRPNIVLIVADDQGYHDVGVYGAVDIATPTLDTMASEGIRFTAFYAGSNVCTPSRGALMTGAYAPRSGFSRGGVGNVLFPTDEVGLNPEEITLAEILKSVGYSTGIIGKWHLGSHPPFLPTRHGFDSYYGIPYSNDMNPRFILENETTVEVRPLQASLTQKYTAKALEFIDAHHTEPFFLYLAHSMPHYPAKASTDFIGRSAYGEYGDVIEEIDWSTEQILQKLLALNIDEQTLVIYTSDNGGQIERDGQILGRNTPLRGKKAQDWEGGMRVPCIMRWPGILPQGEVVDEVAAFIDLYPTLAGLAGAAVPADRPIDGVDIWGVMAHGEVSPRDYFFYSLRAVRSRQWKLVNGELYDLINDISETTNLSSQYPDTVAELQGALDAVNADVNRNARPLAKLADFSEEERAPIL